MTKTFKPKFTITNRITSGLTRIERARGFLEAAPYFYRAGYDFKRLFTISEYYDRDRPAFYRAIQGVRDAGMDMTDWQEFYVDGLSTQLAEVRERGEQDIRKDVIIVSAAQGRRQPLSPTGSTQAEQKESRGGFEGFSRHRYDPVNSAGHHENCSKAAFKKVWKMRFANG